MIRATAHYVTDAHAAYATDAHANDAYATDAYATDFAVNLRGCTLPMSTIWSASLFL